MPLTVQIETPEEKAARVYKARVEGAKKGNAIRWAKLPHKAPESPLIASQMPPALAPNKSQAELEQAGIGKGKALKAASSLLKDSERLPKTVQAISARAVVVKTVLELNGLLGNNQSQQQAIVQVNILHQTLSQQQTQPIPKAIPAQVTEVKPPQDLLDKS